MGCRESCSAYCGKCFRIYWRGKGMKEEEGGSERGE